MADPRASTAPPGALGSVRPILFGTTSYVVPAGLLPNARLLAPHVDDIELVLFEGATSNLPSRSEVRELRRISQDTGCGFTVHLPIDVGIGELDPASRRRAQNSCLRTIELTLPLEPHAFVIHAELPLRYHPALGDPPLPLSHLPPDEHRAWQNGLGESLGRLAAATGPSPLAVENLQFPFQWVEPLLRRHDLGVTLDVGHLLCHGGTVAQHLSDFGERLTVVHLHGIRDGRDHCDIGAFPAEELRLMLQRFAAASKRPAWVGPATDTGAPAPLVVSLEVFGWQPTWACLRTLAELFGTDERGERLGRAAEVVAASGPLWVSEDP
ncbi:MAG: sugar phosphate isomerase/epimerase [Deltaproteobacteria bacterium]|nr:sugar phosphate isomerase/epimerase [Deltaproteobacteria bacterium]